MTRSQLASGSLQSSIFFQQKMGALSQPQKCLEDVVKMGGVAQLAKTENKDTVQHLWHEIKTAIDHAVGLVKEDPLNTACAYDAENPKHEMNLECWPTVQLDEPKISVNCEVSAGEDSKASWSAEVKNWNLYTRSRTFVRPDGGPNQMLLSFVGHRVDNQPDFTWKTFDSKGKCNGSEGTSSQLAPVVDTVAKAYFSIKAFDDGQEELYVGISSPLGFSLVRVVVTIRKRGYAKDCEQLTLFYHKSEARGLVAGIELEASLQKLEWKELIAQALEQKQPPPLPTRDPNKPLVPQIMSHLYELGIAPYQDVYFKEPLSYLDRCLTWFSRRQPTHVRRPSFETSKKCRRKQAKTSGQLRRAHRRRVSRTADSKALR